MLLRIKQIRLAKIDARTDGTDIVLGKGKNRRTYKFRPVDPERPDLDHVCDVTDKEDVATLLAIPEGFEIHDSEMKRTAARPKPDKPARKPASDAGGDAGGGEDETPPADEMSREELFKAVKEKTGKRPHKTTSTARLRQMLAAD